jgi:hypothetical protein
MRKAKADKNKKPVIVIMASYFSYFFYWWTPVEESDVVKKIKEPIIIQAAARNMPNGMLDPSKFSKEESETKCTFQKTRIPICVTKKDLETIKLRKTTTRPPQTEFESRNPVCRELDRYFKEHPVSCE